MFLHLGDDFSVRVSEVISVHEYRSMTESMIGWEFLTNEKDRVEDVSGGKAKSVVITDHKIYFSKLSPETLKKRAEAFGFGITF